MVTMLTVEPPKSASLGAEHNRQAVNARQAGNSHIPVTGKSGNCDVISL